MTQALNARETWELHQPSEVLNNNMTKFWSKSKDPHGLIIIDLKKPMTVFALGFQAANNFPHLDPKSITVSVRVQGE
jgi:hypothetical protein